MVRKVFLMLLVFVLCIPIFAQVPDAFKYQAIVRNSSGEILSNQNISLQISILDGSISAPSVFTETHSVVTNNFGIVDLSVGDGYLISGDFGIINWSTGNKYLKVEVDETGGDSYTDMGAVELLSIPYAFYANSVLNNDDADADPTNEYQILSVSNDTIYLSEGGFVKLPVDNVDDADSNPQNEIQDLDLTNNTLIITNHSSPTEIDLAPYQGTNTDEQILTLINDTLKISNGNEVIFPYDSSNWVINGNTMYYNEGNVGIGSSTPLSNLEVKANISGNDALFQVINANNDTVFAVYPDGVKVFVNPNAKGKVGGFAVSGRTPSKAGEVDILRVTIDSTRIYVSDTVGAKGKVGGFAVSGRTPSKGTVNDYLQVTRDSTRVYITESTTKGKVGGFAVSGRTPSKAGLEKDYFNISANITAENINNEPRIMWYPEKSAFMAGEVHVGSADSVGTNSASLGYRNIAKGNWSQAFGFQSQALGDYSTAIGNEAQAETNSLAVGYKAKATGSDAFALGSGALAIANKSFAFGSVGIDSSGTVTGNTQATGEYAYAFGLGAVASGKGAFAIGANDTASGHFSTAIGYKTKSNGVFTTAMGAYAEAQNDYAVAIGYRNKAQGSGSVSLGFQNNAEGLYSFVSGFRSTGIGFKSIALGSDCRSEGAYSIAVGDQASTGLSGSWALSLGRECESNSIGTVAIGYQSVADGAYSIALGYQDTVKSAGSYGVAIGYRNKATGVYSLAMGTYTNATSLYASSFGNTTIANGQNSFAAGYLSQASGNTATTFGTSNIASGNNSMALGYETEAQTYASLVIGQYNIVEGTTTSWQGTDPLFVAGNGSSGSPSNALTLYQNGNLDIDGNLNANGTIYTSDKRLKTDIANLNYGLTEILKLRPVSFMWKENPDEGLRLGLIAQEVQLIVNEVVDVGNDAKKTFGIRYSELIPVLIKGMQDQQQIIEDQNDEISELKDRLTKIEKLLQNK